MENLNKLTKLLGVDRIMTTDDVQQILLGIMEILKSYKQGTEAINEETKSVVNTLLDRVVESNKQTIDKAETVLDNRMSDLETLLKDVKQMVTDIETMAGELEDGKDADEEKIVEDVISRIKIDPTVVTVSAQEVRDKLASLKDEERLDKSAIKGLDKILTQKDIDYAIATLQQQTSFLINKGGVKSIVAGTNITVDNTDPSNPVISSTGGAGSPGGSTTQLQYNNAGAFGGISGATTDGTAVTYTAGNLIAADITASGSGGLLLQSNNGTDALLIGAGGGAGATFYGGVNIAGELTVDTNTLYVDATNNVVGIGTTSPLTQTGNKLQVGDNSAANQYLVFQTNNSFERGIQYYLADGTTLRGFLKWDGNEDLLYKGDEHWWSTGGVANHMVLNDTGLGLRTSAPTHTLTIASTGTGIALYNTADQTTNYERGLIGWVSNVFEINAVSAGTGTNRSLSLKSTATTGNTSQIILARNAAPFFQVTHTGTTTASGLVNFTTGGNLNASSGTQNFLTITPTFNQSSTAGYTALLVNPTETTTGSGSKLLADFQVGGTSKAKIDNNGLITTPSLIEGFTTTATAAGTTTLTVTSTYTQIFTGTTTQTVRLATTGVAQGQQYSITNNSTGNVTVQSSGANTIQILGAGMSAIFTALVATPTTAANWSCALEEFAMVNNAITATANAATINLAAKTNTVTNNSAAGLTITIPTAGAIDGEMRVVRILPSTAAAQTLTLVNTENSAAVSAPATTGSSTTIPITIGLQYNDATTKWTVIASA